MESPFVGDIDEPIDIGFNLFRGLLHKVLRDVKYFLFIFVSKVLIAMEFSDNFARNLFVKTNIGTLPHDLDTFNDFGTVEKVCKCWRLKCVKNCVGKSERERV